jgi:ceramide glucosyltransferase
MVHCAIRFVGILAAAAALSSVAYYLLAIFSAVAFRRRLAHERKEGAAHFSPPVSILKPLQGTDPEMYDNFRSHCLQDYPEYEIIFGVSDPHDPTVGLVNRLKVEFPGKAIRLVVCRDNLGTNTKVSNLVQMRKQARYEHLIVNDSDIRVGPRYLREVLAPLFDPKIGVVTCLYRGVLNSTFGSKLEALGISTDFCAGVLVAQQLEGVNFGLGSTLAFRQRDLSAIGGFDALVDYLADDYEIGHRITGLGLKGKLSSTVVETFLPRYTLRGFLSHQLRWARTVRDSRFWGYVGLGLTFGIPWALLTLLLAKGSLWAWILLGLTILARLVTALVVGYSTLDDTQVLRFLPLIALRDGVATLVWIVSFIGSTVVWRGNTFKLTKGKLARVSL